MTITLGSLFDGSGGFPLAGSLCGIVPIWASEIEPYPIAVTKSRFPKMKHLGDISQINGAKIEPVDIITFGSPCQDLSIAGKRAGLKHEGNGDAETTRSGLFMEAIRIIKEMRCATNGKQPRFALWENMPGAFSSNKGEDFRIVLEELIKISEAKATVPPAPKGGWPYADAYMGNGWSLAYRTFDAQYWGVPQRRRRIYLVADFAGGCAPGILFKRESLRGHFEKGKGPWQRIASAAEGRVGTDDREKQYVSFHLTQDPISNKKVSHCVSSGNSLSGQASVGICYPVGLDGYNSALTGDKSATLGVNCGISTGRNGVVFAIGTQQGGTDKTENGVCPTITAAAGMSGNNQPWICAGGFKAGQGKKARGIGWQEETAPTLTGAPSGTNQTPAVAYSFDSLSSNSMKSKNPNSGCRKTDVAKTIDTLDPSPNKNQGGMAVVQPVTFSDTASTLRAGAGAPKHNADIIGRLVAQPLILFEPRSQDGVPRIHEEVSPTLNTAQGGQRQPCVALPLKQYPFCKSSRPSFKGDSETYIDCKVSNTLNTFDVGDKRANELIVETAPVYCIQGNCIDRADNAGCNGKGWREKASFTLNTIDRPAVVFAVDQGGGKSGVNFHSDMSPTLTCTHGGEPAIVFCMASGQAHAEIFENKCPTLNCTAEQPIITELQTPEETDTYAITTGSFMQICKDLSPTLAARDYKDPHVAGYWDSTQVYGQNSFATYSEGIGATLRASGGSYGGGSESLVVDQKSQYIVRRLTPTECARLQGFPDKWGYP